MSEPPEGSWQFYGDDLMVTPFESSEKALQAAARALTAYIYDESDRAELELDPGYSERCDKATFALATVFDLLGGPLTPEFAAIVAAAEKRQQERGR